MTDMSISELAAAAGVRRQTVSGVLDGTTWPDLVTVARLAKVLGRRVTVA